MRACLPSLCKVILLIAPLTTVGCNDEGGEESTRPASNSHPNVVSTPANDPPEGTAETSDNETEVTESPPQPSPDALEMTAAELEQKLASLPDGTLVRVTGVIESIPYFNSNLLSGEAVYSLRLYGFYSEPLNPSLTCQFKKADDLQRLTEEQTIVVEGSVIQGRKNSEFIDCRLISKGEIPDYAPLPYEASDQPPLETLTPPEGMEIEPQFGYLNFTEKVIAEDGTLPKDMIEVLGPRLEFGKVQVSGPISTKGLQQILALQGMKSLKLIDLENLDQIDLGILSQHPRLRSLSLSGIKQFGSEQLNQLGTFNCLSAIKVEGDFEGVDFGKVDDTGLAGLASLKSLRWLQMQHKGEPTKITDDGLAALAALPRLQVLDFWSDSFDGSGLSALAACPELHTLNLSLCSVTSDGLSSLASLPKLAVLNVSETEVDSSFAPTVQSLLSLRHLDLAKSKITDEFFQQWGSHPNLTHLSLKKTAITDEGIKLLTENPPPRLTYLSLEYSTGITSGVVENLKRLKTLETLTVPREFGEDATAVLKEAIPGLKVY